MRAYSATGPTVSGTANKTALTVIGAATVRPKIYDALVGVEGTPNDYGFTWGLQRFNAVGTTAASPPTPEPCDGADVAALATLGWTHSAEPTYVTNPPVKIPMNARGTYRWIQQPGYEIVGPATANNGVGCKLFTASTALAMLATLWWTE